MNEDVPPQELPERIGNTEKATRPSNSMFGVLFFDRRSWTEWGRFRPQPDLLASFLNANARAVR
jgi:hypothetical protein